MCLCAPHGMGECLVILYSNQANHMLCSSLPGLYKEHTRAPVHFKFQSQAKTCSPALSAVLSPALLQQPALGVSRISQLTLRKWPMQSARRGSVRAARSISCTWWLTISLQCARSCNFSVRHACATETHSTGITLRLRVRWPLPALARSRPSGQAAHSARRATAHPAASRAPRCPYAR